MSAVTMPSERSEWLDWRRGGIGGSDIAAILGISPWASPWSVWADKVGLLPDRNPSEVMEAGHWLELAIGPWFTDRTGLYVYGEQERVEHPELPIVRATLDGKVCEAGVVDPYDGPAAPLGGLEIKTAGPGRAWDEIPAHYQAQAQWQMAAAGLDRVWFAVLMGRRLDVHVLERDQADIDLMIDRATTFWADHVVTGDPPPVDGHRGTLAALAAIYPDATPGSTVDIDDLDTVIESWLAAKDWVKDAKDQESFFAAQLQDRLGDREEGLIAGQRRISWRGQSRTTKCKACGHETTTGPFRVLRHHKPPKGTR